MIPGPDGSGRQGQVPLENLLFQLGGILARGCGRSSPGGLGMSGKFPNSELTPRSLGWGRGSQGADPGCIPRDFSVECPSRGCQGVTAGSTGAIQGILQHPKAAGASLSPDSGTSHERACPGGNISMESCIPVGLDKAWRQEWLDAHPSECWMWECAS